MTGSTEPAPELLARLRMLRAPGFSPRLCARLLGRFGSAVGVLEAAPGPAAGVAGVGKARAALLAQTSADEARAELERAAAAGADVLAPGDPSWPAGLQDLDDPPLLLFCRGRLEAPDHRGVAVVGSRRASAYGLARARHLARELARLGVTVVSGLARGVDTSAHRGALEAAGRTVAVLGGGLARFYPAENLPLAREIAAGAGAVLSEFPLDAPPRPFHFPRRNRILAALAAAVVVVEAGERSGSLITADHALDIGREVLAVPGRVDSPGSRGTHRLLREGAALCEGVLDIFRALGIETETETETGAAPPAAHATRNAAEAAVLGALTGEERHADEILAVAGLASDKALAALSSLELRGAIRLGPDGRYGVS